MVGSGFSRNASADFPTWSQIGDLFYEKLYGKTPDRENKYLDVPTLAHEVDTALGRPALNRILRDAIPDLANDPSPLHVQLLKLPWSDVLTTNYDTLLERTRNFVTSRRYEVVVKPEDLGHSTKPRIIKLHGSFLSDRPFVVTDEDYRRYPDEFAPFVNTVRQALLEHTLCLIGFSSHDPNFLQWIGWIHDKLGYDKAPKMYLVGLLRLSQSQKTLLNRRNIVPVDMAECPGVEDDHYKALERFLEHLQSITVEDKLEWPTAAGTQASQNGKPKPSSLVQIWKRQRLSYPGWVILPEDRRRSLWRETNNWLLDLPGADIFPAFVDLEFAFELTWRMDKCLCPLLHTQIPFLEKTLNRYLPFAAFDIPLDTLSPGLNDMKEQALTRQVVRSMLHKLLLTMVRYYREEGLHDKWKDVCRKIEDTKAALSPEHTAQFHYERALFALFTLNLPDLQERLSEWPENDSLPLWNAKKAGLLAEIGQVDEARGILEQGLERIRSGLNLMPTSTDYSLVSQESFVMFLLLHTQQAWFFNSGDQGSPQEELRKQLFERWHALRQYKCDPWNELNVFKRALGRPSVDRSNITVKPAFDIGRQVTTRHFGNWDKEALAAYNFLRFCEEVGFPFRMPGCSIATKSAEGALSRIANYSPSWSMATLVRIGAKEAVENIFNRDYLAGMDVAAVDNLVEHYLEALELAIADISTGDRFRGINFGVILASVVPEILSRLCCKCSTRVKKRLVDFLLNAYQSERRGNYRGIRELIERLLESFSVLQQIDLIPRLLDFPILSDLNAVEEQEYVNPFEFIDFERDLISVQPKIIDKKFDLFISQASSDNPSARNWAVLTLGTLYNLGLLSPRRTEQFADALWSRLDDDSLPSGVNSYYRHAFLTLPHPPKVEPAALFKKYVQKSQFPVQESPNKISVTSGQPIGLCVEIGGASKDLEWSDDETHSIVSRLIEWWDADKKYLKWTGLDETRPFGSIADESKKNFSDLVDTLVAVVTPQLNLADASVVHNTLRRVTRELSDYGIPALRLEVSCLHIFPEWRGRVLQRIEDEMASSVEDAVFDALQAVSTASERIAEDAHDTAIEDLTRILSGVSQIVLWRREVGLPAALHIVANVTKKHPRVFVGEIERSVLFGLDRMIVETSVRTRRGSRLDRDSDGIEVSKKLRVRLAAARLAYTLFEHYANQDIVVPEAIRGWQAICKSDDEFAEIKNQWIGESSS